MAKKIGYKIADGGMWILSHLPLWALYPMGFALYFLLYYVVRYRRKVVMQNLVESFHDRSPRQLRDIAKEFYLNFADYVVETIRLGGISEREIRSRITYENLSLVTDYLKDGRPVVAYFSHCINWEWVTSLGVVADVPGSERSQVYRPLKSKWMDGYMLRIRERFHSRCYPKSTVFRELLRRRKEGIATFTGFMSDQKPSHNDPGYITMFLNHPTAMISGTETVARKLGAAVVYFDMTKLQRGRYHVRIVPLAEDAASLPQGELTERYTRVLEENIRRQPSIWLWTHRRWKHPVTLPATSPSVK
ncbi:MAG: lysophospholipid acyltransferase family protein [Muribaculaceae bacterium]|nr:lysophospholipid acyltransferase family protein [Muribaculaceae bacterium]